MKSIKKLEAWFNKNCGWFFTNGNKAKNNAPSHGSYDDLIKYHRGRSKN